MIAAAKFPLQATVPNPIPTSNSQFSGVVLNFNFGFARRRLERRSELWLVDECGEMGFIQKLSRGCFKGRSSKKERKVEIVAANGGEDVFYEAAADAKVQPDHLVIMVNGIIGSAADWRYAAEQLVKNLPDKVIVHRSECNPSRLTFDGVDKMGERLAEEVMDVIRRWHGVRKISFVAHSLGGLVARYAIGRLYRLSAKTSSTSFPGYCLNGEANILTKHNDQFYEASIGGLDPVNFVTFATPHLGSRGHKQLPLLCGLPFLEKSASQTAHLIAGRSGKHLFLTDNDGGKLPLLLQMVKDSDDLHFISALRCFKRRVAYANANYDHVVGWRTSSIRRQNELPKESLLVNDMKYPHIVHIEREKTEDVNSKVSYAVGTQVIDLEEEMIRGLNQVSWERIDVSFHKSRQRYVAHNTIQVKSYWLNSDGADVVQHMIDNLLL
ncbi:alpha/beta-Hydrolases superfamily protein [Perilla frutescens var. hirtella]|uniref:Alpha/beta-Hydrolases superfamily protein n=1 Tax=Perilla frutescens var. hirtella TaxID=608512 RepID=A0AAD4JLS6_PERFH|nr:alpha/beta-Hydrolases superfamily protein [Perilla frutescens var. hirtella]